MTNTMHAQRAQTRTPESDEPQAVAAALGLDGHMTERGSDCGGILATDQAGHAPRDHRLNSQTLRRDQLAHSTATEAQRARIVEMLRAADKSTFDFRRTGIMQSSTRIFELRARGFDIMTVARRDMFDADGYGHRGVAIYSLVSEPSEQT